MQPGFVFTLDLSRERSPAPVAGPDSGGPGPAGAAAWESLGETVIEPDWAPAREATLFDALRRGRIADLSAAGRPRVEPIWHELLSAPYIDGFRVVYETPGGEVASPFGTRYFEPLVRAVSTRLVTEGRVQAGENVRYLLLARPAREPERENGRRFAIEEITPPVPLSEGDVERYLERAVPHGAIRADDASVFVPQRVLDEAETLTRLAGAREAGAILVGHLHRDPRSGDVFSEITGLVPVRHAEADLVSLRFTPDTWADLQEALARRRGGEIVLGWFHSHRGKEICASCPEPRQEACPFNVGFFSTHDVDVQRTVFPRAYNVALLANHLPSDEVRFVCFGWREGRVARRGFLLMDARPAPAAPPAPEPVVGDHMLASEQGGSCAADPTAGD